jgi:hypothetical protein
MVNEKFEIIQEPENFENHAVGRKYHVNGR